MCKVTTSFGTTRIHEAGAGRPLVVFHGGPGLDSSYLREPLAELARWRRVLFFEQLGCQADSELIRPATLPNTVLHAYEVLQALKLGASFGLLGHSWGTHLILSLLAEFPDLSPSEAVLLNPFPTLWESLLEVRVRAGRLLDTILSAEQNAERARLGAIGTRESGPAFLRAIAPLYVADPALASKLRFDFYDPAIAAAVEPGLRGFDAASPVRQLPARTLVVLGEKDYIRPEDQKALVTSGARIETVAAAGHSPFLESPARFLELLGSFLSG